MKFIEPKHVNKKKVDWNLSKRTRHIVKMYSDFTGYNEEEVVTKFLENLLDDRKFTDFIMTRRYQTKSQELVPELYKKMVV